MDFNFICDVLFKQIKRIKQEPLSFFRHHSTDNRKVNFIIRTFVRLDILCNFNIRDTIMYY
ncbi:hypothetical protein ABW11_07355 [Pluralibacter gergoviae]|nr:hypothetical protein ABW08_22940 [Pluralibacter gergoviae]KMK29146.1 hypothetical protein ABW11_07355 [Pluralibacter gergoviae]